MSALEDTTLEKSRAIFMALGLMSRSSNVFIHYVDFIGASCLNGAIELFERGHAVKKLGKEIGESIEGYRPNDNYYGLTDKGWEYARKVYEEAAKIVDA